MPTLNDKVKHIVVLMMENRSFDHMLGGLKKQNPAIDGLNGNETNPDSTGALVQVSEDANYQGDLNADPGHHFPDVNLQLFNGTQDKIPNMQGFVRAYQNETQNVAKSHNIMKYFAPSDLPALTTLATRYAVFNRWFSSIPGPTLCNRAFAHFGTSFGNTGMTVNYIHEPIASIYQRMNTAGKTAKLYYYDQNSSTLGLTFLLQDQPQLFGTFPQFVADCKSGALPEYSFLEPNYKDSTELACDQHPDSDMRAGDDFIGTVYNLLRASPAWNSTALLIVYDEHGGLYDHVPPPALSAACTDINPTTNTAFVDKENGFKFDRLGIRVPAVLVSPWIAPGTVVDGRIFEHASIPATVTNFFIDPKYQPRTAREALADTFLDLLSLDVPRSDSFFFQVSNGVSPHIPAGAAIERIAVPQPQAQPNPDQPISGLLQEHVAHVHEVELTLPADLQTGEDTTQFKTMRDASDYIGKVMAAIETSQKEKTAYAGAQP
jgi:phospholipase C